jgi:hypothetical protein
MDAIPLNNIAIIGAENIIINLEEEEPYGEILTEF